MLSQTNKNVAFQETMIEKIKQENIKDRVFKLVSRFVQYGYTK